jgi:hypothetical protein
LRNNASADGTRSGHVDEIAFPAGATLLLLLATQAAGQAAAHDSAMDNVTLRADVAREDTGGGARFVVTSADPAVTASIRAMVPAHAATMNGVEGWAMGAEEVAGGAVLTVTGHDIVRIRVLGFIGLMTVGMHHQAHHLALASGQNPDDH